MNVKLHLLSVVLFALPLTARAAPATPTPPVLATVEKSIVARREPIRLHFVVRNTLGRTFWIGYTSLLSDWGFSVDWLGADGHSPAQSVRKTAVGERQLAPPVALTMCVNEDLTPGAALAGSVVVINRLFDMRRRGVYTIRVSRRVSPDARWQTRKTLTSPAVQVCVR